MCVCVYGIYTYHWEKTLFPDFLIHRSQIPQVKKFNFEHETYLCSFQRVNFSNTWNEGKACYTDQISCGMLTCRTSEKLNGS